MVGVLAQKWVKTKKTEKQKDKIFKELINEIDNMSIEEYNKYHQEENDDLCLFPMFLHHFVLQELLLNAMFQKKE